MSVSNESGNIIAGDEEEEKKMLLDVVKIIMDEKGIGDGEKLRLIEKIMDLSDQKSAEEKQAGVKIPPMCQRNNRI